MVNTFKSYLVSAVPKVVIKNNVEAMKYETLEIKEEADLFISASLGADKFESYYAYPKVVLEKAGLVDNELIKQCMEDKNNIPYKNRDRVVEEMRKYVINNYVEKNAYYRKINGQPALDQEFIYLDEETMNTYGYFSEEGDDPIPIHKLPADVLISMDDAGYLDTLAKEYPEHEYIPYLGNRKIPLVLGRKAEHYELLYFPRQDLAYRFYRDFLTAYDEVRTYVMSVVFNYDYLDLVDHYNESIGFLIMHGAIQRMINTLFVVMVDRDFYDLDTIREFFDAYRLPFVEIFTLDQQKLLVKNLNILLRDKGDTKVLYDILTLLGYDQFEILKYILVKQHRFTQENDEAPLLPTFVYKTLVDEAGNPYIEEDASQMYDYFFVGVPMNDPNINLPEGEADGIVYGYDEFTVDDPTWLKDADLRYVLEGLEKNYIETKYANININFRMQEIQFELIYLAGLIIDKKEESQKVTLEFAMISDDPISLYDIMILLIALICKRNLMDNRIIKEDPENILLIQGFNFWENINKIKTEVSNHPELYDPEILDWIKTIHYSSVYSVNEMYRIVKGFDNYATIIMQETQDIDVYHAVRYLWNTLLITKYTDKVYAMHDGTVPDRFVDILQRDHPILWDYYNKAETDTDCIDQINYIALKLATWLDETQYMNYMNPIDYYVIDAIITMLRAFKSLTIDIKSVEAVYVFDSRNHNMMRNIDELGKMDGKFDVQEHDLPYQDFAILFDGSLRVLEERNDYLDRYFFECQLTHYDYMYQYDRYWIHAWLHVNEMTMAIPYADTFKLEEVVPAASDTSKHYDRCKMKWDDENDWKTIR